MKKNFLLVFISTIFTILIINFIIIFFANNIFYQKNFPRTLLNFFSKYYALFYPDINDRTFNNYTAVIGDSVAFGSGDEYLDKSYNYSISHKIRKEHNKYNFVNFGFPGAGNYSSTEFFLDSLNKNFPFPKINKPEKIIYLFYEGNDLENNIHFLNADDKLKKKVNYYRNLIDYFPVIHFFIGSAKKIFIKLNKTNVQSQENILIIKQNDLIKKVKLGHVQAPPIELNEDQIFLALDVLIRSLNKIKSIYPEVDISLVYIPSIATTHNFFGEIYIQKYFNEIKIKSSNKNHIDELSLKIRNYINKEILDKGFNFIDTTSKLMEAANYELIYGPQDFKHLNKKGYQLVSEIICENINC